MTMIKIKNRKIKECLPLVNGLWTHIDYQFPEIFDIEPSQLDIVFMSNWSMRTAAPILRVIHADESTSMLNSEELETLADIIKGMYKHKWDKLMDVAEMEYDPIHNFSDHLIENIEYTEGVDGSKSGSGSNSNTRTDNLTKTETDRRGYTDTYNRTDTKTDNLSESHSRNGTETKNQTAPGFTEQDSDHLAFTQQDPDHLAFSQQDPDNLAYTEQDDDYPAYTQQDTDNKKVTEEQIAGFNSSDYANSNKTITDVGRVETSQGKINSSQGRVETSQGRVETSQGKVNTSMGTVQTTTGGSETISNTGTEANAQTGTIARLNNGTLTEQDTGTQTNAGTSSSTETSSLDTDGEKSREYTKTGNIGNISTQKLLNEELDLWRYNFILEMMRDVINFISLPIYEH